MSAKVNATVHQERDRVSRAALYGGATVLALILVAGWFFTWLSQRGAPWRSGWRREAAATTTAPREINMIDQTLFGAHLPSRGSWTAKREALESYSWADRERRVANIPIDRAMQLVVERGRVE